MDIKCVKNCDAETSPHRHGIFMVLVFLFKYMPVMHIIYMNMHVLIAT